MPAGVGATALISAQILLNPLLELLAAQFEPGRCYQEAGVDAILTRFHPDYCALRRYLVEEELLERREGLYWRCGGSFEVE